MDVATITMSREDAAKKLEAYEDVLRRTHEDEIEAAIEGYRALAEGPLVDLDEVFRHCPVDDKGRPRMAIARADRREVRFRWEPRAQRVLYTSEREAISGWRRGGDYPTLCWWVDMAREHRQQYQSGGHWYGSTLEGYALVPMVPPDVLPQRSYLRKYEVLWEVEAWSDKPHRAEPDRDPYLLRHLGGSLCAIVGEWDLTDLERAIMRGRIE